MGSLSSLCILMKEKVSLTEINTSLKNLKFDNLNYTELKLDKEWAYSDDIYTGYFNILFQGEQWGFYVHFLDSKQSYVDITCCTSSFSSLVRNNFEYFMCVLKEFPHFDAIPISTEGDEFLDTFDFETIKIRRYQEPYIHFWHIIDDLV
jgi:hypothetical protein